jgi:demethylmenaquinone methyltransferase/2-methoxy-6-polyprenyl-1,4-benzoquinol methylase
MTHQNPESTSFGTQTVTANEKTDKVLGVFHSVAEKYDIMNDAMSGGLHRIWKDKFVKHIHPKSNHAILDVAGGTGDIAFRMHRATYGRAPITVSDINESMLDVGQDRAFDRGITQNMAWVPANAENLPFGDDSFDIYTIAFGLRNVTHIDTALAEACRVLKKGGQFHCLEFSHVDNPIVKKIYDGYSDHIIPRVGGMIANDPDSYQYLVESIRKFPERDALKQRLIDAGFKTATVKTMTFGVVAIHTAAK